MEHRYMCHGVQEANFPLASSPVLTDLPAKRHTTRQAPESYDIGSGIENFIVQQDETSIFTQVSR